jgi:hypothetical protein
MALMSEPLPYSEDGALVTVLMVRNPTAVAPATARIWPQFAWVW